MKRKWRVRGTGTGKRTRRTTKRSAGGGGLNTEGAGERCPVATAAVQGAKMCQQNILGEGRVYVVVAAQPATHLPLLNLAARGQHRYTHGAVNGPRSIPKTHRARWRSLSHVGYMLPCSSNSMHAYASEKTRGYFSMFPNVKGPAGN